jgi:parallel beta-helix repeat protein
VGVTCVLRLLHATRRRRSAAVAILLALALVGAACGGDSNSDPADPPATTAPPADDATSYVDPQGDDEAAGTMAAPWRTLGRAVEELRPGDVVLVRSGTYAENVDIARGGTGAEPVTVRAFPGEQPLLTGRLKVAADHVRVSGLIVEGRTPTNPTDVAVYVSGAVDVQLIRNEIRRAGQSGIFVGDGSSRTQIVSNWIHDNGRNALLDHGIYVENAADTLVANNVVGSNVGYGIQLYPDADDSVVTQNTVVRNGRSGVIVGGEETTSDRNSIENNIVSFNGEQGIRTFWGGPVGRDNVAANNLVYGNPEGIVSGQGLVVSGTLTEHPGFVDAPRGDYRLTNDSPAVDRATGTHTMPFDRDGRRRPRGTASDLGAYEL